jgi:hypothetical protein
VSLSTLRASSSAYCELNCAYCDLTHSKKNRTGQILASLPLAKNFVLPCNSFYGKDLEKKISEAQPFFQKIFLELHFVTATLERHQHRLAQLAHSNCSWIIHIDHLDQNLIHQLEKWDAQVSEYRIFPSKIYSVEMFLRDLPPFVQKKLKWFFAPREDVSDDFMDLESTALVAKNLRRASLHTLTLASPHWPHTLGHEEPMPQHGIQWSVIDANNYKSGDWPIHLSQIKSSYLGYVASPVSGQIDDILAKNKVSVIFLETAAHRDLLKDFKSHFSQAPTLFLLENFLVRREIWQVYLRTYSNYNHWTWSHFITNENIQTVITPAIASPFATEQISAINIEGLRRSCREHYLETLDSEFYKKYFNFFHQMGSSRIFFTVIFSFIFSLKHIIPLSVRQKYQNSFNSLLLKWDDISYSTSLFGENLKKAGLFVFHRGFWFLHRQFWRLNTALWQCYQVLAPAFGFVSSLSEFPEYYANYSFSERCRLKFLFITRKFAWLALKMVGKR